MDYENKDDFYCHGKLYWRLEIINHDFLLWVSRPDFPTSKKGWFFKCPKRHRTNLGWHLWGCFTFKDTNFDFGQVHWHQTLSSQKTYVLVTYNTRTSLSLFRGRDLLFVFTRLTFSRRKTTKFWFERWFIHLSWKSPSRPNLILWG